MILAAYFILFIFIVKVILTRAYVGNTRFSYEHIFYLFIKYLSIYIVCMCLFECVCVFVCRHRADLTQYMFMLIKSIFYIYIYLKICINIAVHGVVVSSLNSYKYCRQENNTFLKRSRPVSVCCLQLCFSFV